MPQNSQFSLTHALTRGLDMLRLFIIVCLLTWPLAVVAMTLGQLSSPESWGIDIRFFSAFSVDTAALELQAPGLRDSTIIGQGQLSMETSSRKALHIFTLITEVGGLVMLYILTQLRALLRSFSAGESFSLINSARIRKLGLASLFWSLASPVLQYIGGREIIAEMPFDSAGLQLHPSFEINGVTVFIGLLLLAVTGVMNEAASLQEEQRLTI